MDSQSKTLNIALLNQEIVGCERCPRLRKYCHEIALKKRRAYLDWTYWEKPVPSFGDPAARLLILGLAPGAHGANRTGRMFTGDKSGDFLYRSLYRAGFASQPESVSAEDGLRLRDAWITAPIHCAPPDNKPLPEEFRNCRPFLEEELKLLTKIRVVVVLGRIAFDTWLSLMELRRSQFSFGHGMLYNHLTPAVLCSYHPSQQNTSTGKLTQEMLDRVFAQARDLIQSGPIRAGARR